MPIGSEPKANGSERAPTPMTGMNLNFRWVTKDIGATVPPCHRATVPPCRRAGGDLADRAGRGYDHLCHDSCGRDDRGFPATDGASGDRRRVRNGGRLIAHDRTRLGRYRCPLVGPSAHRAPTTARTTLQGLRPRGQINCLRSRSFPRGLSTVLTTLATARRFAARICSNRHGTAVHMQHFIHTIPSSVV